MLTTTLRYALLGLVALVLTIPVQAAEPLSIPVFIKYTLMQQVMLREVFKGPKQTALYRVNGSDCTTVRFANPQLSGSDGLMHVRANVLVKMAMPTEGTTCSSTKEWSGSAVVQGKPLIIGADSLAVQFKVVNAEVFDDQGKPLNNGLISAALEGQLHPLLDRFKMDLRPNLKHLTSAIPFALLGYSTQQVEQLMQGVRLGNIQVRDDGLKIAVQMAIEKQALLKFLSATP